MFVLASLVTCLLIRHGETDWNQEGRLQGQSNVARLTQEGQDQAQQVAKTLSKYLQEKEIEIWTSGLARTDQTAAILAKILNYAAHEIRSDVRLKEADHGNLEGKLTAEYENDPSYRRWKKLSPKEQFFQAMDDEKGESYDKVTLRAKAVLKEIAEQNPHRIKIIVTHGGVINALRKSLTGTYDFPSIKNGEIVVIQINDHEFSLSTL